VFTRTGWGLLVVTVTLVLAAAGWHESALWAMAASGIVALSVATAWRLTGATLELDRRLPRTRVTVGEEVTAELAVTNVSRRPSGPLRGREGFGSTTFTVDLPSVASGARVELAYQLPTERRAMVTLGPFVLERRDPLALASRTQTHPGTETPWIHPRVHAVTPLTAGLQPTAEGRARHLTTQSSLAFHSLREYVVGDDLRQVHWRATAHSGTLMVRHNLDATVPSGVVVLDTRRWVHEPDSFEESVEVAASLVMASARAQLPIRLITTGGLSLDDHRADPTRFLDELAAIQLDDHGRLVEVTALLPRRRQGVALAVVTGGARGRAEDLPALVQLCHGFTQATVVRLATSSGAATEPAPAGVAVIDVERATDFAARWGQTSSGTTRP